MHHRVHHQLHRQARPCIAPIRSDRLQIQFSFCLIWCSRYWSTSSWSAERTDVVPCSSLFFFVFFLANEGVSLSPPTTHTPHYTTTYGVRSYVVVAFAVGSLLCGPHYGGAHMSATQLQKSLFSTQTAGSAIASRFSWKIKYLFTYTESVRASKVAANRWTRGSTLQI